MGTDLKTIQERQRKSYHLLKVLYDLTDGGTTRNIHYAEAFQTAGFEQDEGFDILRYLEEGGLLNKRAPIGWLALSSEGIKGGRGVDKSRCRDG
jgi:hypothetical protein